MDGTWSLDALYLGFDDPAYLADLQRLRDLVAETEEFCKTLDTCEPTEGLRRGILLEEQAFLQHNKLSVFAKLVRCTNVKHPQANSARSQIDGIYSRLAGPKTAFYRWACSLPDLMERVRQDELLQQYSYLFEQKLREQSHSLSQKEEEILARMSRSGSSSWLSLYSFTTGKQTVSWQGDMLPLASMDGMASNADAAIRKAAYEAELNSLEEIQDTIAYCMNGVKIETLTECELRGYDSPLAMSLDKNKVSQKTLDAMLETVQDGLPVFWNYLKAKARLLGHEGGLPWYDRVAPVGENRRRYSAEEARKYLVEVFTAFDPSSGELMNRAFEDRWIDLYPRPGKTGGAFCQKIPSIKQSRIKTNFNEKFSGVKTIAHEMGHSYHHLCTRDHRPLNTAYGYCLSETASTFNEQVLTSAALTAAETDAEKLALLEQTLAGSTASICDIYSRFLFESRVFANQKEKFLDAQTLDGFMLDAQREAYGDGLDQNFLHPYMWIKKSHYYGFPYYNYPYAFGELLSRGLYARYLQEGASFVPKYKEFLRNTTVASAENVAKAAGIDLTDKTFWQDAFGTIKQQVALYCRMAEQ